MRPDDPTPDGQDADTPFHPEIPAPEQPRPAQPPPQPAEEPARLSGLAVTSTVCGCLGVLILPAFVGAVSGAVALSQIERSRGRLRGRNLAIAGLVLSGLTLFAAPVLAGIFYPAFARARDRAKAEQSRCSTNVKQVNLGMLMYAHDYDESLPEQWSCDTVGPYIKNEQVFECPAGPRYRMTDDILGTELADIAMPAQTVSIYGSLDDRTACFVHNKGTNFGFVDGHARWYARRQVETARAESSLYGIPELAEPR